VLFTSQQIRREKSVGRARSGTNGHPSRSAQENHLESGCVQKARRHVKSSSANAAPYIARSRLGSDHTLDGPKEELVALIVDSLNSH
jgi:hypothetical protein